MPVLTTSPRFARVAVPGAVFVVGVGTLYWTGVDANRTFPLSGTGWTNISGSIAEGDAVVLLWENYADQNKWPGNEPTNFETFAYAQPGGNTNETAMAVRTTGLTAGEVAAGQLTVLDCPSTFNDSRAQILICRNVSPTDPLQGYTAFSDSFTGTDGASPDTNKWQNIDASFSIQSNQLRMQTPVTSNASAYLEMKSGVDGSDLTHFEATFDVKYDDADADSGYFYYRFRTDGAGDYLSLQHRWYDNYVCVANNGGNVSSLAYPTQLGGYGGLATTDVVHYRLRVVGCRIKIRVWRNSDSEPSSWDVDYVASNSYRTAVQHRLQVQNDANAAQSYVFVDNLAVNDLGVRVETATGGTASPITMYVPQITPGGTGCYVVRAITAKSGAAVTWGSDFSGHTSLYQVGESTSTSWFVQGVQGDDAQARASTTITGYDYMGYVGLSFVLKKT